MQKIILHSCFPEARKQLHACSCFDIVSITETENEDAVTTGIILLSYTSHPIISNHDSNNYHVLLLQSEADLHKYADIFFHDYISFEVPCVIVQQKIKNLQALIQTKSTVTYEQNYMQLVEQLEDSVILLDSTAHIRATNTHFCTISEFSKHEILQKNIHLFFPETDLHTSIQESHSQSVLLEAILCTKSGDVIPKEIRISPITIENESLYIVIARDISERLKALKKLEESENRFRTVIKHSPNGMIIFRNDTISYINLCGTEILKGVYEDFIEQPFSKLIPEMHKTKMHTLFEKASFGEISKLSNISMLTTNGKEVWVNVSCIPIDLQGERHYFILFQDVTEQRSAKYDLENKDYRLREIQKLAKLGHWENNIIKNNLYWSDEIFKIYGVNPKQFKPTYKKLLDFVHPDDRESVRQAYATSLKTREPYKIVHRIILHDGTMKYVNEKCSTIFNEQGEPLRSLGTVMDITHTITTEKALQQTEENFQLLFENLNQPFLICKPIFNEQGEAYDFSISDLNSASEKLFRGDFLDVKDRTILELFHDPHFWIAKYKQALETSETVTFRKYSTDLHRYLDIILFPVMGKKQIAGIYTDVTQKVYAENKLQQLTTRLQQIQEYAKIGFYDVNIVTHHSKWSTVMLQIFEYSKHEKQSFETYVKRIHPDDRNRVRDIYAQSIKQHRTDSTLEFRLLFPDGRIKHIYTEFLNIFEGKTCLKTEGWLQDISDLRSAISALRESEEKLRMVTSGTKLGLWEWDVENKEFALDHIGSSMIGYTPEEIWGDETIYLGLIHEDDKEVFNKNLKRFWRGSTQLFSAEYRVKIKAGRYKWISSVGVASDFNAENTPSKMIGFNQDITSRKKVESDLRESENKFRRIFEIENDSLFLIDSKTYEILETNNAASKLYGYSRKELLKRDFYSLSANPQHLLSQTSQQCSRVDGENALKNTGETCPVEMSLAYFIWKGKHVILAAVRDVSERHRFEQELVVAKEKAEESDSLKSAFLANMSHEIRTPLNAIVGFSRLLARKNYDAEKRNLFIQDIQSNSNQLLTIINDILDISKIESGQFILNPEPICINRLLQEVYDSFSVQLKSKDISLFCEKPLSDVDVTIIVDEVRLKQILGNLLHNALKFTEKGYVQFGYKKTNNDFLQLFVKDTGIGIAPEKHAIVFEHFRQEDDTTIRKYGGTGLGLSISKRLIELMNGTMYVESEKGKGATFYVNVPFIQVYESEQDNAISHISLQEYTHFNGEYILVCDDYASSFVFISEMLEDENIHVLQAKSGEEAIEICKNSPTAIDLVLMDIQMAGMNGIDAMHTIKKINPTIPVIAQTAFAQKGDRERFLLEGFDEYITKPLDERELHSIIKRLLKIKRG